MSRDARSRIAELENELMVAKVLARRFWGVLVARIDIASAALFRNDLSGDALRVVDSAFDAAQIVWERHRVLVEPCRRLLDAPSSWTNWNWPSQPEIFIARHPGGEVRNITREQLMMMAGMDADA